MTQPAEILKKSATQARADFDMGAIPDPDPAAFFHFSRYNADVSMLVGHINIPVAVQRLQRADGSQVEPIGVPVHVTHQFHLSLLNFYELREKVEQFARAIEASGIRVEKKP